MKMRALCSKSLFYNFFQFYIQKSKIYTKKPCVIFQNPKSNIKKQKNAFYFIYLMISIYFHPYFLSSYEGDYLDEPTRINVF